MNTWNTGNTTLKSLKWGQRYLKVGSPRSESIGGGEAWPHVEAGGREAAHVEARGCHVTQFARGSALISQELTRVESLCLIPSWKILFLLNL